MNVLAINSSARVGGESKTEWMLNHLVHGMREAGATVEIIALKDKKINYCSGCFTCWSKTPGTCIHKDDMTRELMAKWIAADLAVYATPLYHYTVNAHMKTFIERTLPVAQPFLEAAGEKTRHPLRHEPPGAVVLSVAGFPEDSVFDVLSSYVNFMFKDRLRAEIYRPAAETMTMDHLSDIRDDIAKAVQRAGHELIDAGKVSAETMERIKQPVVKNKKEFRDMGNMFWKTCIAEGVSPREFRAKKMVPRPDSIETFMLLMQMALNRNAARDVHATMQYQFSGEVKGQCYFIIENGSIQVEQGAHPNPQLTVTAPFEVWMDIITRKADGQEMFMKQKYSVAGDLNLLMKMGELFGR